jgi:uncharacterized membrane protein YgcG
MTPRLSPGLLALFTALTFATGAVAQTPPSDTASPPPQTQPAPPPQAQPAQPQQGQASSPQQPASGQQQKQLSQAELDQLVAPIALYPDPLLSNVMMAATYPVEVVEAKRWLDKNKSLKGKSLKAAADKEDWDNSVRELTATPPVLAMMSDKLEWTQKLGDAVLNQQQDVMDAVQRLRARAQAEDQLKTTKQQKVVHRTVDNRDVIAIEPASRSMAYVPYYDPGVVYGAWAYPDYPPYYWPGYYYGPDPLVAGLVFAAFAVGAWAIADNWWGGDFDWWHRDIFCCRNVHHRHRDRDRFAHNADRRNRDNVARNRDNRNADRLNDRNNRRDRQANLDNRRNSNKKVSQRQASNKQLKRANASQKRVANRSSVNRNHVRNQRASFGGHGRGSFAQQRGGMRSFGGGGGRHFGGGGGGGGRAARGGGGRRGR